MAFNLATTELSTIFIDQSDPLDHTLINKKILILLKNDESINRLFSNAIEIWQCSWYYDSNIRGYDIGDAVWLNTEDPDTFVKNRYRTIKLYTDLNSQILNKLPAFDPANDEIINQYKSAMSGYTDNDLGKDIVLPPIFDIGDFSKPIQLLISLKNNNKSSLNDETAWRKVFIDTDDDGKKIRSIINNYEKETVSAHLVNYHLSGHEASVKAKLSNYLDDPSQKTYYYTTFPLSSTYLENTKKPNYGIDYVRYSIRKPHVSDGIVSQYQGVRYWNSGMLEHFGTIATNNKMFIQDDGKTLLIPFNWQIANDESGARVYESGELGSSSNNIISAHETLSTLVPPEDNFINVLYEKQNVSIYDSKFAKWFKDANYNISLHPIYQDQAGIANNYIPVSYGEEPLVQHWNANYLTNEILNRKNRAYFTMRLQTRVLPPYISYYAVGKGDF